MLDHLTLTYEPGCVISLYSVMFTSVSMAYYYDLCFLFCNSTDSLLYFSLLNELQMYINPVPCLMQYTTLYYATVTVYMHAPPQDEANP